MQNSKSSLFTKLAVLATAVTFSGSVFAATPTAEPSGSAAKSVVEQGASAASTADNSRKAHSHKKMRRHHHEIAMWVPGYGAVSNKAVQSLELNDSQAKLLTETQTSQKELRTTQREAMKAARAARSEQLKAGKIDPRAAIKESETFHQKAAAEHQKGNQKWLAFWDALDQAQQKKVAAYFNERAEKKSARAKKHSRPDHKAAPAAAATAAS